MARRGENIYKRKDGRWEGRILNSDGTYKYVYDKSYKGVKEKKKNYKESHENEVPILIKSTATLFEFWLKSDIKAQIKPSTYEYYYNCIKKYVIPFFSEERSRKLTAITVNEFIDSVNNNVSLSESHKRKIITVFKTALRKIIVGTAEYSSILKAVKLPKVHSNEIKVFSVREQQIIEDTVLNFRDKRALGILLCFYTGIRLGELCALKWSDIDFNAKTMSIERTVTRIKNFQGEGKKTILFVGTPKSRKSIRKIPIPDFLMKIAEEFMTPEKETSYIFSVTKNPIDPRVYQKLYKRVLLKAGVKDRKFHTIRHTFATRSLELGVDIKTLSEILGHSNVSITLNIYAHSLVEQKRIAINKLNEMHTSFMKIILTPSETPSRQSKQ